MCVGERPGWRTPGHFGNLRRRGPSVDYPSARGRRRPGKHPRRDEGRRGASCGACQTTRAVPQHRPPGPGAPRCVALMRASRGDDEATLMNFQLDAVSRKSSSPPSYFLAVGGARWRGALLRAACRGPPRASSACYGDGRNRCVRVVRSSRFMACGCPPSCGLGTANLETLANERLAVSVS